MYKVGRGGIEARGLDTRRLRRDADDIRSGAWRRRGRWRFGGNRDLFDRRRSGGGQIGLARGLEAALGLDAVERALGPVVGALETGRLLPDAFGQQYLVLGGD